MKIFKPAFEVAGVESSIRSLMECIEKGSTHRCSGGIWQRIRRLICSIWESTN